MKLPLLWTIAFTVLAAAAMPFGARHCLHMLQLESYQGNMYIKWLKRLGKNECATWLLSGLVALFLRLGWLFFYYTNTVFANAMLYAADVAYLAILLYSGISNRKKQAKKPMVYTGRMMRLMVALALIATVFHLGLFLSLPPYNYGNILLQNLLRYLPGMLLPFFVLVAHFVILPIENIIKKWYYNDAKRKLAGYADIVKIGITGSFGKTSTKFILGTILQEKWNTLVPPSSFNTPMGLTRVIREQLEDSHEVFVAEMGARYRGDIAELCELVQPQYAIITSVGKQHLDTFGDYSTVISTKAELLQALPEDGAAFLNGDNADCLDMYAACSLKNKFLFGLHGDALYMRAEKIEATATGSDFTLVAEDGEKIDCKTSLLGAHNICNITAAAALAYYLGMTLPQIKDGIEKIQPVEHRLQLIPGAVTVIDDAFNANPAGTKAALEVLRTFQTDRRIIVTPGMVELGEEEEALNEEFGKGMASVADVVILVGGRHVEPIKKGLLSAGFDFSRVIQVADLNEATEKLPLYAAPGSVVLFENDLPDNYSEKLK